MHTTSTLPQNHTITQAHKHTTVARVNQTRAHKKKCVSGATIYLLLLLGKGEYRLGVRLDVRLTSKRTNTLLAHKKHTSIQASTKQAHKQAWVLTSTQASTRAHKYTSTQSHNHASPQAHNRVVSEYKSAPAAEPAWQMGRQARCQARSLLKQNTLTLDQARCTSTQLACRLLY